MKVNQLVSLLIVLAVAGVLALMFRAARERQVDKVGGGSSKTKVLPGFPVNDVTAVSITAGEESIHLSRKEGTWGVKEREGYPADFEKLGELLRDVYDMGIVEKIPVGPSKFGRVGLLDPAGEGDAESKPTVISFQNEKGDEISALWVGKEYKKEERSQFGSFDQTAGRYVKRPKGDDVYLVAEEFADAKTDPAEWINKDFFQVSKVKSVERISAESPEESWKLVRDSDTGDFTLVDAKEGEELDSTKVSSMKNAFSSPSFEDVLVGEEAEKPATVTFKVETFEGFRYEVKVNEKNEANEYLLMAKVEADLPKKREAEEGESEEDKKSRDEEFKKEQKELKDKLTQESRVNGFVYKVRGYVADSINKNRSELLKEKEEAEEAGAEAGAVPGLDSSAPGLSPN